jgi:predicted nucleic acid-binding protein
VVVVSNTSPIVNLAAIGHLHLLRDVFGAILIPDAVHHEIVGRAAQALRRFPGHHGSPSNRYMSSISCGC